MHSWSLKLEQSTGIMLTEVGVNTPHSRFRFQRFERKEEDTDKNQYGLTDK